MFVVFIALTSQFTLLIERKRDDITLAEDKQ